MKRTVYDPIALSQRHQEILNLHVRGVKNPEIAAILGIHPQTAVNTINSTLGQEKLAIMRGTRDAESMDVLKEIQRLVPKALKIYDKILSEEEPLGGAPHAGASINLQKATADTIMKDLSGHAAPKKLLVGTARVTPELLKELKEQGKKAASECGILIDVQTEQE